MTLTPKIGRVAFGVEGAVSGVVLRYLRAASESGGRLSAREYFAPYLSDLLAVLRSRGIELYNANINQLTVSQPVIDDILGQQEFEQRTYPDRAKPYEALRHDVALWHLVAQRRPAGLQSPLDAVYWVVTVDYRLLGFDAFKQRRLGLSVPLCIHPTVLLQALQLWEPRSPDLDIALIHTVRAFLPQVFDPHAEQVAIRILTALSRFENVDDLSEETIAAILLSQALRNRIGGTSDRVEQIALIRDALLSQYAEREKALHEQKARAAELESTLEGERSARVSLEGELRRERSERNSEVAQLKKELEDERAAREELATRVQDLSAAIRANGETRRFLAVGGSLVLLVMVSVFYLPPRLGAQIGFPVLWSVLVVTAASLGIGGLALWALGRRLPAIAASRGFRYYDRAFRWVMGALWLLFLGLLANLLWYRIF